MSKQTAQHNHKQHAKQRQSFAAEAATVTLTTQKHFLAGNGDGSTYTMLKITMSNACLENKIYDGTLELALHCDYQPEGVYQCDRPIPFHDTGCDIKVHFADFKIEAKLIDAITFGSVWKNKMQAAIDQKQAEIMCIRRSMNGLIDPSQEETLCDQ
jgi:hypothetical protein